MARIARPCYCGFTWIYPTSHASLGHSRACVAHAFCATCLAGTPCKAGCLIPGPWSEWTRRATAQSLLESPPVRTARPLASKKEVFKMNARV